MKKVLTIFFTLLLVLSTIPMVSAASGQVITVPMTVSGTSRTLTINNDMPNSIVLTTDSNPVVATTLPSIVHFYVELDALDDGLPFSVTSSQVTVKRHSIDHFTFEMNTSSNVTLNVVQGIEHPIVPVPSVVTLTFGQTPTAGGSVLPASGNFISGTEITITAVPMNNYHFQSWHAADMSIFLSSTAASTILTVPDSNMTVTAMFGQGQPQQQDKTLTLLAQTGGTVSGGGTYAHNLDVTVNAYPDDGYKFVRWQIAGAGTIAASDKATTTVKMTADITITAVFEQEPPKQYEVMVNHVDGFAFTGEGKYEAGKTVVLTVARMSGNTTSDFLKWYAHNNTPAISNPSSRVISFTMPNTDVAFTIDTVPITPATPYYSLNINADIGGSVQGWSSFSLKEGDVIDLQAHLDDGYEFDSWITSGGGTFGNKTSRFSTFKMPNSNVTVTATFKKLKEESIPGSSTGKFTLTITTDGNGLLSGTLPSYSGLGKGATTQIGISAKPGYVFDKWVTANGGTFADASKTVTLFTMPENDVTIMATFKEAANSGNTVTGSFTLSITTDGNGTLADTLTSYKDLKKGDVTTVSVTPVSGYVFDKWVTASGGTFADTSKSKTLFTMPDNNATIMATFKATSSTGGEPGEPITPGDDTTPPLITFNAEPSEGGSQQITGLGGTSISLDPGQRREVIATAKPGYTFDRWEVIDGVVTIDTPNTPKTLFTVGAGNTGDVIVVARYKQNVAKITVPSGISLIGYEAPYNIPPNTNVTAVVSDPTGQDRTAINLTYQYGNPPMSFGMTPTTSPNTFTFLMPAANVTIASPTYGAAAAAPLVPESGQQGPPGPQGEQGPPGPQGEQGPPGETIYIDNTPAVGNTALVPNMVDALDIGSGYLMFTGHDEEITLDKTDDMLSGLTIGLTGLVLMVGGLIFVKKKKAKLSKSARG